MPTTQQRPTPLYFMQPSCLCGPLYLLAWLLPQLGGHIMLHVTWIMTSLDSSSWQYSPGIWHWIWLTAVDPNALLGVLVLTYCPSLTCSSLSISSACQDSFQHGLGLFAPNLSLSPDLPYGPRHNLKGPRLHNFGSKFVQGRSSNENLALSSLAHP